MKKNSVRRFLVLVTLFALLLTAALPMTAATAVAEASPAITWQWLTNIGLPFSYVGIEENPGGTGPCYVYQREYGPSGWVYVHVGDEEFDLEEEIREVRDFFFPWEQRAPEEGWMHFVSAESLKKEYGLDIQFWLCKGVDGSQDALLVVYRHDFMLYFGQENTFDYVESIDKLYVADWLVTNVVTGGRF